jgi:hypothetical protein
MSKLPARRAGGKTPADGPVDEREGLFNDAPVGSAAVIQIPAERITKLHGFVVDVDPKLLVPGNPAFPPADDPRRFYDLIRPVLDRHPLARHAEVRNSGTGLHLITRFEPAVEFRSAGEQRRWAALVRACQCSLPSDPAAPGITALTRSVGSVNAKNGATVEVLRPAEPVDPARVAEFVAELADAPFQTVAMIWLGTDQVAPCPVCRAPGSRLGVLDRVAQCYRCGKVTLEALFDAVLVPDRHGEQGDTEGAPPAEVPAKSGTGRRPAPRHRRSPERKAPKAKGRSTR